MKRIIAAFAIALLLASCQSTQDVQHIEKVESCECIPVDKMDDIRTTVLVNGRMCTLTLSAITGEKSMIVADGKRYRTYALSELPVGKDGRRYLYSTAGNINVILSGSNLYISIETDWTETRVERDFPSPFIFATHA